MGKYTLAIREKNDAGVWGPISLSEIEIVKNNRGSVVITGDSYYQYPTLRADVSDSDTVISEISYQWKRDNQTFSNANQSSYSLSRSRNLQVLSIGK